MSLTSLLSNQLAQGPQVQVQLVGLETEAAGDVVIFYGRGGVDDPNHNFLYTSFYRRPPFGPTVLIDRPPDAALADQLGRFPSALIIALSAADLAPVVPPGAVLRRLAFEPGAASLWRAQRPSATMPAPATTTMQSTR